MNVTGFRLKIIFLECKAASGSGYDWLSLRINFHDKENNFEILKLVESPSEIIAIACEAISGSGNSCISLRINFHSTGDDFLWQK